MKKTRKSGRNVKQSTENTTQKTSTSTSGVQQLKMKIEIELESSLFNKWQKLRTGEGMASDTDIVSFLIQQHDKSQPEAICIQCHTPIAMLCAKCDSSMKKETDEEGLQIHSTPQAAGRGDTDEGELHNFEGDVYETDLKISQVQSFAGSDPGCTDDVDGRSNEAATSSTEKQAVSVTGSAKRKQLSVGPFKCSKCHVVLVSKTNLKRHMATHHDLAPYECSECGSTFRRKDIFNKHLKSKHKMNNIFPCQVCDGSFGTHKLLRTHMETHGEKPYTCKECKKSFTFPWQLKNHSVMHTGEKPYKCDECGASFAYAGSLRSHKLIHTGQKPYVCTICNRGFTQSGALKTHVRRHSGEKPYKCSYCERSFPASYQMKSHMKTHMSSHIGGKPGICCQCGVSFRSGYALKVHMRFHTGEKPHHVCQQCGLGFITQVHLTKHMCIHSDQPPRFCKVCSKSLSELPQAKDVCTKCDDSLKDKTDEKVSQVQSSPQTAEKDNSDEAGLHPASDSGFSESGVKLDPVQFLAGSDLDVPSYPSSHNVVSSGEPSYLDVESGVETAPLVDVKPEFGVAGSAQSQSSLGPVECPLCHVVLARKQSLQRHMETHQTGKSYQCGECGSTFSRKDIYNNHLKDVHKISNIFPCKVCDASFATKKLLREHVGTHGEKPYVCRECNKRFAAYCLLKAHSVKHTGEKPFKCKDCFASFAQSKYLSTHRLLHTGERPYVCSICSKGFTQSSALKTHMRRHLGVKPYMCSECGKSFAASHEMKTHMSTHSDAKPVICCKCGVSLKSSYALKLHMCRHTGEKPYKCQQCGLGFIAGCELTRHMSVHSDQHPHVCDVCSQSFPRSTQLKQHMHVHRGDKALTCPQCEKVFFHTFSLKRHMTIHTGKEFTCTVCNTSVCSFYSLNRHMKNKHSNKQWEVMHTVDAINTFV